MPDDNLNAALPAAGKLLGLDLGTKTIGVAISDGLRFTATPLETIARTKFTADAERLPQLVAENAAVAFVLGLPLNMDGSEGPRVQSTRAFARNLAAKVAASHRFLGRAALDRCRRPHADRGRHAPRQAGRSRRQARGRLHSAGLSRPAKDKPMSRLAPPADAGLDPGRIEDRSGMSNPPGHSGDPSPTATSSVFPSSINTKSSTCSIAPRR